MNSGKVRFFLVQISIVAMCIAGLFAINRWNKIPGDAYIYGIPEIARFSYTQIEMHDCAWCKSTVNLNRHHIVPQSVNRLLRDEPTNIVVLCRTCHYVLGHRCSWRTYNPDVLTIVQTYTNCFPCAAPDAE